MPDTRQNTRIVPKYTQLVNIPVELKKFLWDETDKTPAEKLVFRVLSYGNFEQIQEVFDKYPEICFYVIHTYPEIHRGVKYWIKQWYNERKVTSNSSGNLPSDK